MVEVLNVLKLSPHTWDDPTPYFFYKVSESIWIKEIS